MVTSHAKLVRYLRDQGELQLDAVSDSGPLGVATLGEDLVSAVEMGYPYSREIAVKGAWPPASGRSSALATDVAQVRHLRSARP